MGEEYKQSMKECRESNAEIFENLMNLYERKKLIGDNGKAALMCDTCEFSSFCYLGAEDRKPSLAHEEWAHLSIPWIGKKYGNNKIALLGVNPNEDGGLNELYILIEAAKSELSEGKVKVDFGYVFDSGERKGQKYKGTFLWHRMAAYSKAIGIGLKNENCCDDIHNMVNFEPKNVSSEFDNIAYLNQVKCSPLNNLSKPTNKMWENCGKHILLEELKILSPEWLIVLGTGDNIWALNRHVLKGKVIDQAVIGKAKCYTTTEFGTLTKIIAIPHPAAPAGGANKKYYQMAFEAVQILKGIS